MPEIKIVRKVFMPDTLKPNVANPYGTKKNIVEVIGNPSRENNYYYDEVHYRVPTTREKFARFVSGISGIAIGIITYYSGAATAALTAIKSLLR